ncbi:MAG: diguanylate cyclase [Pseudomonadota bacterium]
MSQPAPTTAKFQMLRSIKAKVSIFALMATLVPSVVLGLLHYNNSLTLQQDKISQGLQMTAENAAREASKWLEQRRQALQIYSGATPIVSNIAGAMDAEPDSRKAIVTYLDSVMRRSPDVLGLAIYRPNGELVVSTESTALELPPSWLKASVLDDLETPFQPGPPSSLLVGYHMTDYAGERLGFITSRVRVRQLTNLLNRISAATGESICLLDDQRRVIAHNEDSAVHDNDLLGESLLARLRGGNTVNFWHQDGTEVVARMSELPSTPWAVLAERDSIEAYAEIRSFRQLTIIISTSLMLAMAGIAYIFSTRTLAPLRRLTQGATQVASGDLNVRIKVRGKDEIAYLTRVFNNMVERLEAGRKQVENASQKLRAQNRSLKVLSNTDSLTGLYNRQHLNDRLERLVKASADARLPFAILMIDLDHFKALNDQYGHVAGDQAIRQIAEHIRDTLRKSDYAARYGGEEFVVLLPKVDAKHAFELAERLRLAVASTPLHFDQNELHLTASIGVAAFPEHGRTGDLLIRRADAALYEAKDQGRNRTAIATSPGLKVIPAEMDSSG